MIYEVERISISSVWTLAIRWHRVVKREHAGSVMVIGTSRA